MGTAGCEYDIESAIVTWRGNYGCDCVAVSLPAACLHVQQTVHERLQEEPRVVARGLLRFVRAEHARRVFQQLLCALPEPERY